MANFVKKTALGGYKAVSDGYSDLECTHVVLEKNEYSQLLQEKKKAEQDAGAVIRQVRSDASREVQKVKDEAHQKLTSLEQELAEKTDACEYLTRLNENLLRMSRERSNVDRKLEPKKTHTGYVVMYSSEKEYRYRSGNQTKTVMLWETNLQSPYSVDFTEKEARNRMQADLFNGFDSGVATIQKIGITEIYLDGYTKMICDKERKETYPQYNVMLEWRLRANFRFGYWEIIFMHTKPLSLVPKEMRACKPARMNA